MTANAPTELAIRAPNTAPLRASLWRQSARCTLEQAYTTHKPVPANNAGMVPNPGRKRRHLSTTPGSRGTTGVAFGEDRGTGQANAGRVPNSVQAAGLGPIYQWVAQAASPHEVKQ
jgi:hypothetical protein